MGDEMVAGVRRFLQQNAGVLGVGALTLAGAAATSLYFSSRPEPLHPPINLNNQSIVVNSEEGIRACGMLSSELFDDVKTTYDAFLRGLKVSENGPCLGTRLGPGQAYTWLTYKQVLEKARCFGSGLVAKGLAASNSTFVGIYSSNCAEWAVVDLGCQMFSMVPVPLYDTLGTEACHYIINQANLCTIVCNDPSKAQRLLQDRRAKLPSLRRLILIGKQLSQELSQAAINSDVELILFKDFEAFGEKNTKEPNPPNPEDLATLCYTSGTTGDPKGVMLTHANFLSQLSSIYFQIKSVLTIGPDDVHLSYLPLAHMFERCIHILLFMLGARIGYSSGDIRKLTEDLMALKPTIFPTVPRLLNRIYDKVFADIRDSWLKSSLFNFGLKSKLLEVRQGIIRRDSIWDKLIFSKIQQRLGGRVRLIVTGSAPLLPSVMDFVRCVFGCLVLEGYGQTESTAGITLNVPGDAESGSVGPPLACNLVKLMDVPDMDYFSKDNKGEVCCKGSNVMKGYYNNPEKTAETVDKDGWLHTGDIGMWLPNGTLKIIDRKKNIFKLAQGEYVPVEKVENVYLKSRFVGQCFIEGDSLKPCLMAVVVPDEEVIKPFAANNELPTDLTQFCQSEKAKEIILKDMLAIGKAHHLRGFEQAKDVYLHPVLFSVENDLLTPTLKNKRPALRKAFKDIVNELYQKHNL